MTKQSSSPANTQEAPLLQTKPDKLKVGLYVDLNCSWFKHPFASKTFKIKSEKDLAIIRGLGLDVVLVDPSLSDRETLEQWTKNNSDPARDPAATPSNNALQDRSFSESTPSHPFITRYKESLQQADMAYKQTLLRSSSALDEIKKGSETGLTTAKEIIDGLTDLLLDDATSSAIGTLLGALDLEDKSVLHSMNVAVLSMLVGRQFDLSPEQTKALGIAGLLHDIGEKRLPPYLQKAGGSMTAEDWTAFQQHVDFGLRILAKFPGLPDAVTDIIRHHHERIDGSGYPSQLQGNQLPLLSRILMLVEEYERLINAPNISKRMTPTEALSKLYLTAKTTFSEEVVTALIQTLTVYPPGTVVELNDKSIGLVISINMRSRMRPMIVLYDPTVDQKNPNIANLNHDPNRSIVRSITREELSHEVSDYLNLARWMGYFINSSMKSLETQKAAKG